MFESVIMTHYFYPIQTGGTSKFFGGIYFDNPRTIKEIKHVESVLKSSNSIFEFRFPEDESQVPEECITLRMIVDNLGLDPNGDKFAFKHYSKTKRIKNIYYALAKLCVIVRCNEVLDAERQKQIFCISAEECLNDSCKVYEPLNEINFARIKKSLLFLSFMTNPPEYANHSIIINNLYNKITSNPHPLFASLLAACSFNQCPSKEDFFPYAPFYIILQAYNKYIDLIGSIYNDEKFLFICDTLYNFFDLYAANPKMYLIGIVGLIEMLLTHNPDASRFNIEDTISKQFVKKLKYIIYKNNNQIDLNRLEKELKFAYSIRSDIAHGNFGKSSSKNLKELLRFYNIKQDEDGIDYIGPEEGISNLNENLIKYTKILLEMYLRNPQELELIKDL